MGSSPRVRGTAWSVSCGNEAKGIIPACAGNRIKSRGRDPLPGDHPRVCGEQGYSSNKGGSELGSSPRVRGTVPVADALHKVGGIIPACAGNSLNLSAIAARSWDHPRVCGEQRIIQLFPKSGRGSSPRVRGTDVAVFYSQCLYGIIPACAGNRT